MNIGIISTRYARALYSLAFDRGQEDVVYEEMKCLSEQYLLYPELRRYLDSPILKSASKIELLKTAAGGKSVSFTTSAFIEFVVRRGKQDYMQYMCAAYQTVYRKAKNIVVARLLSAADVDEGVIAKVRELIAKSYQANVELETKIDKNLIGGFVLDVDNNRLDASVAGELHKMRVELLSSK